MKKTFMLSFVEANSFCARCLTLLVLALMSTNLAWGEDKTVIFKASDLDGTANTYELKTGSSSNINFSSYSYSNSNVFQFNGERGKNIFFNTSAMPGAIKSIKATKASGTDRTVNAYVSKYPINAENYTSATSLGGLTVTDNGTTWTLTAEQIKEGYTYFYLNYGTKGALYVSQFEVTYEVSTTPTEAYTVTFNAGINGTCSTTELTEASAGAGVTLPECTANDGYVFKGWSTTEDGTTANAGKAGETYKPSSNCTLYAVYAKTYVLTITQPVDGGTLTVKNGDTQLATGSTVEVGTELTCEVTNIPEGKRFSRFYAKWGEEDGKIKYKGTNPATFDNIATENITGCTIYVTYQDLKKYTINYYVNGVNTNPQENVYEGTELVFPNVDGIAGKAFRGWVEEAIDGTTDTKPTFVTTTGLTATADKNYYAVFANKEGEGDDKYVKVTSAPTDWSGEYLLVYEGDDSHSAVAWTGVDDELCGANVTISNGEIATKPESAVTLTIATMEGGYSIKVNGGNNNGKYINQTSYANGMSFNEKSSANTLSHDGTVTVIAGSGASGDSHVTMRYNSNSDQLRFRYYRSGQQPVQLYKLYEATYSNYCTDISYTRTVNIANIGTLCVPYAFEKPETMTLYNIVGKDESKIYFEENTDEIVAGKPYLFRSTAETITLTYTGERAAEAGESNGLVGTYEACPIEANDGNYILSSNTLYVVDGTFNCGANRAYIHIDGIKGGAPTSAAKSFALDFDDPTGINTIDNGQLTIDNSKAYNLNGVRVNEAYKGIVIMNGKKYINK